MAIAELRKERPKYKDDEAPFKLDIHALDISIQPGEKISMIMWYNNQVRTNLQTDRFGTNFICK